MLIGYQNLCQLLLIVGLDEFNSISLLVFYCLIDPTSLDGRNLPDYPSFIFDLFEMVVDTFEMQRQYLSSSMTILNLITQLIANKGNHLNQLKYLI